MNWNVITLKLFKKIVRFIFINVINYFKLHINWNVIK